MRRIFYLSILIVLAACSTDKNVGNTDQNNKLAQLVDGNFTGFEVQEVIHTSHYTYLRVKEENGEKWLALPLADVKKGEVYYYSQSMLMENFESKELKRTFEKIYFIERILTSPEKFSDPVIEKPIDDHSEEHEELHYAPETGAGQKIEKVNLKVESTDGSITIRELFSKKKSYEGKKVIIRGQVVKFTPGILKKNWLHIQDGTEYSGKYDLTVTTNQEVKAGETVVLEGKISLDKDLGYGYFFEVIMEDAVLK